MRLIELLSIYILFLITLYFGVQTAREWQTINILCPEPEKLLEIHTDGREVLCVYEKPTNKPRTYRKGTIK